MPDPVNPENSQTQEQARDLSVPGEDRQKEDWSYYYALYHMLAHWTAFLTILVLLITLGVLWNSAQIPRVAHPGGAAIGLAVLCGVELYLLWCIFNESAYLLRKLPISAREPELIEPLHKHPVLIFSLIGLGALAFTVWDVSLVLDWW